MTTNHWGIARLAACLCPVLSPAYAQDCNENGIPDRLDLEEGFALLDGPVIAVGRAPMELAGGDLDGDLDTDLAVANRDSRDVSILINDGSGSFTPREPLDVRGRPDSLLAGDLDGDGDLDLATVTSDPNSLGGFENRGSARLEPRVELPLDARSEHVVAADLDGDAVLDLVTGTHRQEVLPFLNRGDLSFEPAPKLAVEGIPLHIAVGDLDQNGHVDIVACCRDLLLAGSNVSVIWNDGNSRWTPTVLMRLTSAVAVTARDLDDDGRVDLTIAQSGVEGPPAGLVILFNAGRRNFASPLFFDVPAAPSHLVVTDLDADGRLDLVATDRVGYSLSVLLNRGEQRFVPMPLDLYAGMEPMFILSADLDGDMDDDLAVLRDSRETILFQKEEFVRIVFNGRASRSRDCNGNGAPDECDIRDGEPDCNRNGALDSCEILVAGSPDCNRNGVPDECDIARRTATDCNANEKPDACELAAGEAQDCNTNGIPDVCDIRLEMAFSSPRDYPAGKRNSSLRAADLDVDQDLDLLAVDEDSNRLLVLENKGGDLDLVAQLTLHEGLEGLAISDFDGDGDADVAASSRGAYPDEEGAVSILLNDGAAKLSLRAEIRLARSPGAIAPADLDRDGDLDLAITVWGEEKPSQGFIAFLLNDGQAGFVAGLRHRVRNFPGSLAVADLDGDGDVDFVTEGVSVLLHDGGGGFAPSRDFNAGGRREVVAADLDSDGDEDLVLSSSISVGAMDTTIAVLLNDGGGWFRSVTAIDCEARIWTVDAADLDGDGDHDLMAGGNPADHLAILANKGNGSFARPFRLSVGGSQLSVASAALDGEPKPDIAVAIADSITVLTNNTRPQKSADDDGDSRPDECGPSSFRRGDADGSSTMDVTDAIVVLDSLFRSGPSQPCENAVDANDDGRISISDPIWIVSFLLLGGAAPPPPFAECGPDRSPSSLDCKEPPPGCQ